MGISVNGVMSEKAFIKIEKKEPSLALKIGVAAGGAVLGFALAHYGMRRFNTRANDIFSEAIESKIGKAHHEIELDIWGALKDKEVVQLPAYKGAKKQVSVSSVPIVKPKEIGHNLPVGEREYYSSVIDDFERLNPAKETANPYLETENIIQKYINDDKSEITYNLDRYAKRKPNPLLELTTEKGKLSCNDSDFWGDEVLIAEYKDFLNGTSPTAENFKDFTRHRSMNYLKENGVPDMKAIEIAKKKGAEIEKAEKLYHEQRQAMYSRLWREYPTVQFYRVVGIDELMKMLRGETIIGKNSIQRYGRKCVDVTPNPYYHDIFYGETKFRIPFKMKTKDGRWNTDFTGTIYEVAREKQHYQVPSYRYEDVEIAKIKMWDGDDWVFFDWKPILEALKRR